MNKAISKSVPDFKSMDYDSLRKEGIRLAELLSGLVWTDYNEHDPGVTLLESLCFGITDLGYRGNFDIQDVLFSADKENPKPTLESNAFFPAHDILPCAPLTKIDYRILIIDGIEGVDDAWVVPKTKGSHGYKGLYSVLIKLDEYVDEKSPEDIKKEIKALLNANRNLCEDFEDIVILDPMKIVLSCTLDISPEINSEHLLAELYFQIENYLNPRIERYSFPELIKEGYSVDQIFNGPLPKGGFIKKEDLKPLSTQINLSQFREIISKIEGVFEIKNLRIKVSDETKNAEVIEIKEENYPTLDFDFIFSSNDNFGISVEKSGLSMTPNLGEVQSQYYTLVANQQKNFGPKFSFQNPKLETSNSYNDLKAYYSIQRFLPNVYGVGDYGVPISNNITERTAQAKQLKAYLLLFEQFFANHLTQLINIRNLFSIDPPPKKPSAHKDAKNQATETAIKKPTALEYQAALEKYRKTYFTQFPADIPDIMPLFNKKGAKDNDEAVANVMKQFDNYSERRNRFLQHLSARFGEHFPDQYLDIFYRFRKSSTENSPDSSEYDYLDFKAEFLRNIVDLSKGRGLGFDYSKEAWNTDNSSVLKKRLSYFLNLPLNHNHSVTSGLKKINLTDQKTSTSQTADPQPSSTTTQVKQEPAEEGSFFNLRQMLALGGKHQHYFIEESETGDSFSLYFCLIVHKNSEEQETTTSQHEHKHQLIFQSSNKEACEDKKTELVDTFKQMNQDCEGFHLVEHILLRPQTKVSHKMNLKKEDDSPLLEGITYRSIKEYEDFAEILLVTATNPKNYVLAEVQEGGYFIVLQDDDEKYWMRSSTTFSTYQNATEEIQKMVDYLTKIKKNRPGVLNSLLTYTQNRKEDSNTTGDFYSRQLSLVFPKWPSRFQNKAVKPYLQYLFHQNVPAHLKVNLLWLNVAEMEQFEKIFKNWLTAKQDPVNPDDTKKSNPILVDKAAKELEELIRKHTDKVE